MDLETAIAGSGNGMLHYLFVGNSLLTVTFYHLKLITSAPPLGCGVWQTFSVSGTHWTNDAVPYCQLLVLLALVGKIAVSPVCVTGFYQH